MNETLLKKLEERVNRRTFLRGSGLAAAAVLGVAAFPRASAAQDQAAADPTEVKDDKDDKDQKPAETAKAGDGEKKDEKKETDPFKETKKDEAGRDYRMCPQCGYNMYKQDRTWTCENCGYSYEE